MINGRADEIQVRGRAVLPSRSVAFADAMRNNGSLLIRNKKKAIFSTLLLAVTVFCLLAITPPASEAATGMATIPINTLGGTNADNSAAVATESQWSYGGTIGDLAIMTADGNYKVTGTNTNMNLCILQHATNVNLTLDNVNITCTSGNSAMYIYNLTQGLVITLVGNNSLTATASNTGILNNQANDPVIYTGSGNLTVTGGANGPGINVSNTGGNNALWILGGASVTAIGGSDAVAIRADKPIKIGDNAKLTMTNKSASAETHTFTIADATTTHMWKLTNATLTSGNETNATIVVTVAPGETGTVQRVPIPPTTTDVTFTAVQTGGTSGTATSTGIVLTFSEDVTGLAATNIKITNGTGSAIKGALTGSGKTYTIAISSVTQGNVTVAVSNFGAFKVTGGAKTVAVYAATSAPIVYDVKSGGGGTWNKGSDTGHAITVGAPSSKVTGVNVDNVPVAAGDYTVANNASGDAVVTLKASYLETLGIGSHTVKVVMNDGSASTTMNVAAAGDAEGGGGSSTVVIVAVVIAVLAIAVLAYMFVIKPKIK